MAPKPAYFEFLDRRIPQLFKKFPGRLAREQADREWADKVRKEKGK